MSIVGSLPYTLTNGATADANQVQVNLQYIADQVNANVATAVAAAILAALPIGTIADWSGAVGAIPAPWALCDGANGTPDLRDKFLVGAGGAYAVGATGGAAVSTITVAGHVLTQAEIPAFAATVTDPNHTHDIPWDSIGTAMGAQVIQSVNTVGGGRSTSLASATGISVAIPGGGGSHAHTATQDTNLPPYYALAKIMKIA